MIDLRKKYRIRDPSAGELVSELKGFDIKGLRYPVVAAVRTPEGEVCLLTWGADGSFLNGASGEGRMDLIEALWHDGLKDGDPVMVRMCPTDEWSRRHFAGLAGDGNVLVYCSGRSKWTNADTELCEYVEGRRPTAEELVK